MSSSALMGFKITCFSAMSIYVSSFKQEIRFNWNCRTILKNSNLVMVLNIEYGPKSKWEFMAWEYVDQNSFVGYCWFLGNEGLKCGLKKTVKRSNFFLYRLNRKDKGF